MSDFRMYTKDLRRALDSLESAHGYGVADLLLNGPDREYWIKFIDSFLRSASWPKDHEDTFYITVKVDPKLREVSLYKSK